MNFKKIGKKLILFLTVILCLGFDCQLSAAAKPERRSLRTIARQLCSAPAFDLCRKRKAAPAVLDNDGTDAENKPKRVTGEQVVIDVTPAAGTPASSIDVPAAPAGAIDLGPRETVATVADNCADDSKEEKSSKKIVVGTIPDCKTAFDVVCHVKDDATLEALLALDGVGQTLFHRKAQAGDVEFFEFLEHAWELHKDYFYKVLDAKNCYGQTLLHSAVLSRSIDCVKYMRDKNNARFHANSPDVHRFYTHATIQDVAGFTPAHLAAIDGNTEITSSFKFYGLDHENHSVLHHFMSALLEKDAIDERDEDCIRRLCYATRFFEENFDWTIILRDAFKSKNKNIIIKILDGLILQWNPKENEGFCELLGALLIESPGYTPVVVTVIKKKLGWSYDQQKTLNNLNLLLNLPIDLFEKPSADESLGFNGSMTYLDTILEFINTDRSYEGSFREKMARILVNHLLDKNLVKTLQVLVINSDAGAPAGITLRKNDGEKTIINFKKLLIDEKTGDNLGHRIAKHVLAHPEDIELCRSKLYGVQTNGYWSVENNDHKTPLQILFESRNASLCAEVLKDLPKQLVKTDSILDLCDDKQLVEIGCAMTAVERGKFLFFYVFYVGGPDKEASLCKYVSRLVKAGFDPNYVDTNFRGFRTSVLDSITDEIIGTDKSPDLKDLINCAIRKQRERLLPATLASPAAPPAKSVGAAAPRE